MLVLPPNKSENTMKKLVMILALAAATVGVQAQDKDHKDHKTPQERAQLQTGRMTKELSLTTEQAAKVEAINLKYANEFEAKRADQKKEREAKRAEGKAIRDAHDAELKAVLTPEQYTQWQAKKEAMKAKQVEKRKSTHEMKKSE